jgi:cation:H+ antiporter
MAIFLFIAGLVFLIVGAEALVRGASRLAAVFGISPLVIGLTVVAMGTSSPELAVSVRAALAGQSGIAVGNIVGSNILNVLLILGLSALITPLLVSQKLVRLDVPLMILSSVVVLVFAWNGTISRWEGIVLLGSLLVYLLFVIYQSRRESGAVREEYDKEFALEDNSKNNWAVNVVWVIGGLMLLVLGARWLVNGAVVFAQHMGVSEVVIGLTVVAVGTSLPEVFTSVIAAVRGERDIAVGNIVGSNLFNVMGVLGLAGIVAPAGIDISSAVIRFDIPVMIAVSIACLPLFFTGGVISRQEGALLLGYYVAYMLYLILAAVHHDALAGFGVVMLFFVIPLTAVTVIVIAFREWLSGQKGRAG